MIALNAIMWIAMAIFGCIGFVHAAAWIGIRLSCKGNHIYRVIPIGGEGKKPGDQMALMYTCLQWESNPSKQRFILYDAGLDEQGAKDCAQLAQVAGVGFARSMAQLEEMLGVREVREKSNGFLEKA